MSTTTAPKPTPRAAWLADVAAMGDPALRFDAVLSGPDFAVFSTADRTYAATPAPDWGWLLVARAGAREIGWAESRDEATRMVTWDQLKVIRARHGR